jgi:NADH-quinone oxidoreductase subunit N
VTGILVLIGLLSLAISGPAVERERLPQGEYYALLLFALAGMILMATASDLLVIFLAVEVLSLALYVLTGIRRNSPAGTEAAFKYILLGGVSSAFFLYGIAFTYGVTGSTRLERIGQMVAAQSLAPTPMQLVAMAMLLVGFAFKISAVPFHMWAPDAYEGAPAAVTGFMSTGVKAAALAAFARVFLSAFSPLQNHWTEIVWAVSIATMILGTVAGVLQANVKRMLAYSSISHAGYLLIALASANDVGKSAMLFYLLAYALANLGAFGVLAVMETTHHPGDRVIDFAGLGKTQPVLAALMTVFLLSLGGLPPTAGFVAKWYVFSAAIKAGYVGLALVGVLTSVIAVFVYLRIVVTMYMTEGVSPIAVPPVPKIAAAALVASAILIFYLGILPSRLLELAAGSIASIF